MKKWLPLAVAGLAMLIATTAWVQTAAQNPPLTRFLPPGPLLVVEARDFSGLLDGWDASPEKAAWLASVNYAEFQRSKLYLRLDEARQEFAAAAGVTPNVGLLESVAGAETVLGLYDIGELRFVYVTEMTAARATAHALWEARGEFEPREVAGQTFYARSDADSGREAAFAVAGARLVLGTSADLVAGTLERLAAPQKPQPSAAQDAWYVDAIGRTGERGEVRLVHHLEPLRTTPYFRSYWIQQNITDLGAYTAGVADFRPETGRVVETRVLVKAEASQPGPDNTGLGAVTRLAPDEAGLFRAWVSPTAEQAVDLLERKILAPEAPSARYQYEYAPSAPAAAGRVGFEGALETRIDREPPKPVQASFDRVAVLTLIEAAAPRALLTVESTRKTPGGVFFDSDAAVTILASSPWDAAAARETLSDSVAPLWTASGLGAAWVERPDGAFALDGLAPLYVHVQGPYLTVTDSEVLLEAILPRFSQATPAHPAVFAGGFRHALEAERYRTWMGQLDFLRGQGPNLFSDNLGSVSRTLERVEAMEVARVDRGDRVEETVVYTLAP